MMTTIPIHGAGDASRRYEQERNIRTRMKRIEEDKREYGLWQTLLFIAYETKHSHKPKMCSFAYDLACATSRQLNNLRLFPSE